MIRATYYLMNEAVHIAVEDVILCSLSSKAKPIRVMCSECGSPRFERIYAKDARSSRYTACGECSYALSQIGQTATALESFPETEPIRNI